MQLQPLKADDIAALARVVLRASPGPALTTMLAKAGGNPLWAVAMLRSLDDEGMVRRAGHSIEATTSDLPASLTGRRIIRPRWLTMAKRLSFTAVLAIR